MIQMQTVESSMIAEVGHDPTRHILRVKFQRSSTWDYDGVTPEEYQALVGSGSVGKYFRDHIKGKKSGRQVS